MTFFNHLRISFRIRSRKFCYKYILPSYIKYQEKVINKKETITVVFFAANLAMWRYQKVYELMLCEKRFNPVIVLSPTKAYLKEQQISEIEELRVYFRRKKINFIDWDFNQTNSEVDVKREINPDIIFFTQPYEDFQYPAHDYHNFIGRLFCYCQYGIGPFETNWFYNQEFHNIAWRLFYATSRDLECAKKISKNKGKNVAITGYPNIDFYNEPVANNPWLHNDKLQKRIIWAPHFTISSDRGAYCHSSFLWLAEPMLKIAERYRHNIQFAFKPHPKLLKELYLHKDWGKEKADAYYEKWRTMENTQVVTGDFIDLFKCSDGMIHDSSSFTVEYLYTKKPVMFTSSDIEKIKKSFSSFGAKAVEQHYIGKTEQDVEHFLEEVILRGDDQMQNQRKSYYSEYLEIQNGISPARNIIDDIKKQLKLDLNHA